VLKELKRRYPAANIAAVDYDPGASEVNQINRIKLMMSVARRSASDAAEQGGGSGKNGCDAALNADLSFPVPTAMTRGRGNSARQRP
jgi:predicted nucleotide-binding protein (sugar kinase/HSP70/actin superfamily)